MPDAASPVLAERLPDGVLLLTLNRPARLNAWTREMEELYFDHLLAADEDPEIRAIVVTGAGRAFCAGADMDDLAKAGEATQADLDARRPQTTPLSVRKPIIAAVNGPAVGLGMVHALYCDVRFAATDTAFHTAFVRRGLVAEYGSAWLLPRLVGHGNATEILLSGRPVGAEEALRIGLVSRVVEADRLLDETVAYATMLATQCAPSSIATMKAQLTRAAGSTFEEAATEAAELMLASFGTDDHTEGVASFVEKRAPRFAPLPTIAGS
ncbi:enoyl-CoA hydratase-related protein [Nocardioides albidus]|uniref:enoyl-CoA hydratase-related protein n=1 Tax=Nocardioides albidus TaxID=1517589 RepID=UPI0019618E37|nr:enoyl-CoA hydratase-related protein [Nocardioides albidus]